MDEPQTIDDVKVIIKPEMAMIFDMLEFSSVQLEMILGIAQVCFIAGQVNGVREYSNSLRKTMGIK
jgi:hypothetical protein